MLSLGKSGILAATLAASLLMSGGCSTMKPGDLASVEPVSTSPRVGNVYLFRGIIGVFSTGLDQLGLQINQAGVHADVYQDDQWTQLADMLVDRYQRRTDAEPLVLVGHSWGADHILSIAQRLNAAHVPVTLVLTLDPVTPPVVPANVERCENLYESNGIFDVLPAFRGVPLKSADNSTTILMNYDLHSAELQKVHPELFQPGVNHFSIEKQQVVHDEVIKQVLAACPPRADWYAKKHPPAGGMMVQVPATPTTQPVKSVAVASE